MKKALDPSLLSCEDRFAQIKAVFNPDVDYQKQLFIDKISRLFDNPRDTRSLRIPTRAWSYLPEDYRAFIPSANVSFLWDFLNAALEWLEFGDIELKDLKQLAQGFNASPDLRHHLPPYFGQEIREELNSRFVFIHFASDENTAAIKRQGFIGNLNIEEMYSTKKGTTHTSEFKKGAGFIYAYRLKMKRIVDAIAEFRQICSEDDEGVFKFHAAAESAIIGYASKGLEVFHFMDDELQVIIPVECISRRSLIELPVC